MRFRPFHQTIVSIFTTELARARGYLNAKSEHAIFQISPSELIYLGFRVQVKLFTTRSVRTLNFSVKIAQNCFRRQKNLYPKLVIFRAGFCPFRQTK